MFPLIHGWTDVQRSPGANLRLGLVLSFVAGATNAGGFLAVGRYTSHMTGIVSSVADDVVLGHLDLALAGLACLMAFLLGAMCTAIMVNWGLRQHLRSSYSLPLMLESCALLVFGLFGAAIAAWSQVFLPVTVVLLCFIMGLQNAVITKISNAEIRTTHITGLLTDIGIELGKWVYLNRLHGPSPVKANRERLRIRTGLVMGFLLGGLLGAMGFKHWGYVTTVPLAGLLWLLSLRPLLDDLRQRVA
jgi:uncharacterized membrane protein YoaK (UPF0700 family)